MVAFSDTNILLKNDTLSLLYIRLNLFLLRFVYSSIIEMYTRVYICSEAKKYNIPFMNLWCVFVQRKKKNRVITWPVNINIGWQFIMADIRYTFRFIGHNAEWNANILMKHYRNNSVTYFHDHVFKRVSL